MSRVQFTFTEKPKSQRLHPVWRGIGCISVIVFTVGVYALAGLLMRINYPLVGVPPDITFQIGPVRLPIRDSHLDYTTGDTYTWHVSWIRLAFTVVLDIILYGLIFVVYSLMHPIRLGPKDAPPVRPRKGHRESLIR